MLTRRIIVAAFLFTSTVGILLAKNKWDDADFRQWDHETVAKLFNDSPWAQQWTHKNEGTANQGINEQEFSFTVRVLSSVPIRQAYVRMLQLMNKYDALASDGQKDFDARVTTPMLNADVKDEVVLAVAYKTNDQNARLDLKHFFDNATSQTLNQQAYIFSPEVGRVDLKTYVPPGKEGMGARFIYPRVVNGKPLLQPGDKEMRFQLWVSPINDELRVGFDARKMIYKDVLNY